MVLDTGKEWGGGTNSLLELLKRADRTRYEFKALFYNNYRKGPTGADIKTEIERLGVRFALLEWPQRSLRSKLIREAGRTALFFSTDLRKMFVFGHDYRERILPLSIKIAGMLKGGEGGGGLRRVGAEGRCDLLYMNNQPSSNLEGVLAAKAAGVRSIQHSRIETGLNSFETRAVNRDVSRVICVSKGVLEALVDSGVNREKCSVIYNGIDPALQPARKREEVRKELGAGEGALVIGTVGSLIRRKRVELLLEASAMLKGIVKKCVVVGEGPLMEDLKNSATSLGIADSAVFTGFSEDPLSYINAMDIFVLPSAKEGLPRVILEAMLMSKPVIAFNVTGPSELVIDGVTGALLKDESAEALATAVVKMREDKSLIQRMGEAGRARVVENFSVERYVKDVERVFEEVLA